MARYKDVIELESDDHRPLCRPASLGPKPLQEGEELLGAQVGRTEYAAQGSAVELPVEGHRHRAAAWCHETDMAASLPEDPVPHSLERADAIAPRDDG
jgi:hypothetical protein